MQSFVQVVIYFMRNSYSLNQILALLLRNAGDSGVSRDPGHRADDYKQSWQHHEHSSPQTHTRAPLSQAGSLSARAAVDCAGNILGV